MDFESRTGVRRSQGLYHARAWTIYYHEVMIACHTYEFRFSGLFLDVFFSAFPLRSNAEIPKIVHLKKVAVPFKIQSVIDFFDEHDLQGPEEINGVRLNYSIDLLIENTDAVPGCAMFEYGYLNIATTENGDVFCLDLNQKNTAGVPVVVIASHDEISEDSTKKEIEECVIKIADSFEEFLTKFQNAKLPSDYYDTE